jgi:hypothetical protein
MIKMEKIVETCGNCFYGKYNAQIDAFVCIIVDAAHSTDRKCSVTYFGNKMWKYHKS